MTAKFVDNDPVTEKEIQQLRKFYREHLSEVAQSFALHRGSFLIGSSGTMENIGLMIAHRNKKFPNLSVNELAIYFIMSFLSFMMM
jgi:exopolyphosphatase / guanosine-5'-triphosphate,3'-diphosphate pyrophosphatase